MNDEGFFIMRKEPDFGKDKKREIAKQAGDKDYSPLYEKMKGGSLHIDHKRVAHLFVKLIATADLHPLIQRIMQMRLLGQKPDWQPMTITAVALQLGLRKFDVKRFEKEGLYLLKEFYKKVSIEDGKNKFNQNSKKLDLET